MGLEPTTFCMASRRSSQLSYSRAAAMIAAPPAGGKGRLDRRPLSSLPGALARATSPQRACSASIPTAMARISRRSRVRSGSPERSIV
jgi:hypothetical protein